MLAKCREPFIHKGLSHLQSPLQSLTKSPFSAVLPDSHRLTEAIFALASRKREYSKRAKSGKLSTLSTKFSYIYFIFSEHFIGNLCRLCWQSALSPLFIRVYGVNKVVNKVSTKSTLLTYSGSFRLRFLVGAPLAPSWPLPVQNSATAYNRTNVLILLYIRNSVLSSPLNGWWLNKADLIRSHGDTNAGVHGTWLKAECPSRELKGNFWVVGIKAVPFGEGGGEAVGRGSGLHRSVYLIYRSVSSFLPSLVLFFYLCANAARALTFWPKRQKVSKERFS